MNIGIITFNFAQNWGAVLQGYALQKFINDKTNHKAKMIFWEKENRSLFMPAKTIPNLIHSVLTINSSLKRVDRYSEFRKKYTNITEPCFSDDALKALNSKFECFITGSDQVWSVSEKGVNRNLFLSFAEDEKVKISYAASFGKDNIPDNSKKEVKELLQRFNKIAVREESGKKIVNELISDSVDVVLDPVFLLNKDEWMKIANYDIVPKKKYVFVYPTQITKEFCEIIKNLKNRLPKEYEFITPFYIPGCKTLKSIGPSEFVALVANAEFVLATSFHATAFSILFNKNFWVIPHSTTGSRMTDLCKSIKIEDAIVNYENSKHNTIELNYDLSNKMLNDRIQHSKDYLLCALNNNKI